MAKYAFIKYFLILLLFFMTSCTGNFQKPLKLSDELGEKEQNTFIYKVDKQWWLKYHDDELNNLINTALINNPDYLRAALNMSKELYNLNLATSDLFPTVYGTLNAASQRNVYTKDQFNSNFSGDLGLNYEVDIYGKIRNLWTAQEMKYLATSMDKEAAKLTLINSVVDLYFNLEYLQNSIELTKENIKTYEDIQKIAEQKYQSGKTDNVEYLQAKQCLLTEQNQLLNLQTNFKEMTASLQNILNVKSGVDEIAFGDILAQKTTQPNLNIPVSVLAQRPDLKAAEYRLQGAFEKLKAENKNWYPEISINGALSSSSDKARTTFDFSYIVGSVSLNLPFLDWNRVKNNIKISQADYQISLLDFKNTLNQALNEISYYNYAYLKSQEIYNNINKNYLNAIEITNYYRNRYNLGKIEFKDFLEAIYTENSLKKDLVEQKYQIIKYENYIYKAMAGRYELIEE